MDKRNKPLWLPLLVWVSMAALASQAEALRCTDGGDCSASAEGAVPLFEPRTHQNGSVRDAKPAMWALVNQASIPFAGPVYRRKVDLGFDVLNDRNDEWRLRLRFHVRRGRPQIGWLLVW
jgi:hypothetical protein